MGKLTAALKALGELPVDVAAIKQSKIASTVKKITEIPMDLEFKPLAVQLLAKLFWFKRRRLCPLPREPSTL